MHVNDSLQRGKVHAHHMRLPSQPPWLPTGQEAATGLALMPPLLPALLNTDQLLDTAGGASARIASTRIFTLPACSTCSNPPC